MWQLTGVRVPEQRGLPGRVPEQSSLPGKGTEWSTWTIK